MDILALLPPAKVNKMNSLATVTYDKPSFIAF